MGVPFINNKQANKHPCESFQLEWLWFGSGPALAVRNAAKWPVARVLHPHWACAHPCNKENAPLPRHVISHPGRQLKCKLKMLIRTVSTSILMHKMGILYSVPRKMHCSSGKTLPPLLLWSEQKETLFFFFKPAGKKKYKRKWSAEIWSWSQMLA